MFTLGTANGVTCCYPLLFVELLLRSKKKKRFILHEMLGFPSSDFGNQSILKVGTELW